MNYVTSQCALQRILAAKPPESGSVVPTHFPAYGRIGINCTHQNVTGQITGRHPSDILDSQCVVSIFP